jgi:hypothetical protein
MSDPQRRPTIVRWVLLAATAGLMIAAFARVWSSSGAPEPLLEPEPPLAPTYDPDAAPLGQEADEARVVQLCGACHAYPPPSSLAKYDWSREVIRGFEFLEESGLELDPPPPVEVARHYINRAPTTLPAASRAPAGQPGRFRFGRAGYRADGRGAPAVSNVRFVRLFDDARLDVLACDMARDRILALKPYEPDARPIVLATGLADPAHAEVVDLDRDGVRDILVATLGDHLPSNDRVGGVTWLRGGRDGGFTPIDLIGGIGRVADARATDFDGDGDLDLVVASFGSVDVGEILYLENRTTHPARPEFAPTTLDPRHGTIHVPVADLNGDGRPDFVALISQEHETVVAFLNEGEGRFAQRTIYSAPHPSYGSSGIELVDLDADGDLDVLMTNGDVLDRKVLRPDHGVRWLENRGEYPFEHHALDAAYGASRAVAGDLDGDGDLDIVAATFLPGSYFQRVRPMHQLDGMLLLEQVRPGEFVRHTIEPDSCDHASCDIGDFDGDGRLDIVTANCFFQDPDSDPAGGETDWIIVGKNLGPPPKP